MPTEKRDLPIIKMQVEFATDNILGGYENSIADGNMRLQDLPPMAELVEEIYTAMKTQKFFPGSEIPGAMPEVLDCDKAVLLGLICNEVLSTSTFLDMVVF